MTRWMERLQTWAQHQPLAIRPDFWRALIRAASEGDAGDRAVPGLLSQEKASGSSSVPAIAVVQIRGLVMQHENFWTEIGVAVSTEGLTRQVRALAGDPAVVAIVLDVDSPGGGVYGVEEAATAIREARAEKPIVAVANSQAASAAYWLASAATEIVVTPSGEVGSVGVFAEHWDASVWYEKLGVKPTLVKAGRYKAEFADVGPLSDEALEHLQRSVDEYYDQFVASVAKGRQTTVAAVRSDFGEGRMVSAKRAVAAGMADRVGTLTETLAGLVKAQRLSAKRAREQVADLEFRERRLRLEERAG